MEKIGAQGKYTEWLTEDGLMMITGWVRDGLTKEQVARKIGISVSTYDRWRTTYPPIRDAVKKGMVPVAEEIENNFYSRCQWRNVTEVTKETFRDEDGNVTGSREKKVTKPYPPDTAAMIFALKNLKPHKWRDKPVERREHGAAVDDDKLSESLRKLADSLKGDDVC